MRAVGRLKVMLGANEIYLGDCLEIMNQIADCSIDMILADLPYGTTACHWDSIIPLKPLWEHYKRVIKPNGAIVLTGSQPFTTILINSNFEWFKYEWIWVKSIKTGFQHSKNAPMKRHENVIVFSSGVVNHENMTNNRMKYYPQLEFGKPYKKVIKIPNVGKGGLHRATAANMRFVGSIRNNDGVRYPDSVLEFPQHNNKSHPSEKPIGLFSYLILTYTNPGDIVLDNVAGSGTTAIAAIETGRQWICIEKDPEYYQMAKGRIETRLKQPFLPGIVTPPNNGLHRTGEARQTKMIF